MVPSSYKEYMADLKQLVDEGVVPMSRIDDAVTRILRVKFAMGMMDPKRSPTGRSRSAEKLRLARASRRRPPGRARIARAVEERTTRCRLKKTAARIHVAGKSADDIGNQCGGWTIDWQGKSGDVTTGGTTMLAAIKKAVSNKTQVTFSKDGTRRGRRHRWRRRNRRAALRRRRRRSRRPQPRARGYARPSPT